MEYIVFSHKQLYQHVLLGQQKSNQFFNEHIKVTQAGYEGVLLKTEISQAEKKEMYSIAKFQSTRLFIKSLHLHSCHGKLSICFCPQLLCNSLPTKWIQKLCWFNQQGKLWRYQLILSIGSFYMVIRVFLQHFGYQNWLKLTFSGFAHNCCVVINQQNGYKIIKRDNQHGNIWQYQLILSISSFCMITEDDFRTLCISNYLDTAFCIMTRLLQQCVC